MRIEITPEIENILKNYTTEQQENILRRAWGACCDGEALERLGILNDPWDGNHEEERMELELSFVKFSAEQE